MTNSMANRRRWKKSLRYLRWGIKAAFFLLFMVPVAYIPRGQLVVVSSFFYAKPANHVSGFTYIESPITVLFSSSV